MPCFSFDLLDLYPDIRRSSTSMILSLKEVHYTLYLLYLALILQSIVQAEDVVSWASLPSGPLALIAGSLPTSSLPSFILVCKYWMSAGRCQVLELKPKNITDDQLERVCAAFPCLERLDLSRCLYLKYPRIGHLTKLTLLKIGWNGIGVVLPGSPVGGLENLVKLQELRLEAFQSLGDDALRGLTQLASLKYLSLTGNKKVTDKALEGLENCQQLVFLDLSSMNITDAVLPSIGALKCLESLSLGGNHNISQEALLIWIPELTLLTFLDIYFCSMVDEPVLADTLKGRLPALRTIVYREPDPYGDDDVYGYGEGYEGGYEDYSVGYF